MVKLTEELAGAHDASKALLEKDGAEMAGYMFPELSTS